VSEPGNTVAEIGDRLGQIEKTLAAYADRTADTGSVRERDIAELHEALVKLNANQQTLASTFDQWRQDAVGDVGVISNQVRVLEDLLARRTSLEESVASQVASIHNAVAGREVKKSRFRRWLFGTEEWYAASYDTERWRARQVADMVTGMGSRSV